MKAQVRMLQVVLLGFALDTSAAAFYKHVDAEGNVTYSDRPQQPGQAALSLPPANVATPEARRQLDLARQRWAQEERVELDARMRQWAAAHRSGPVGYSRPLSPGYPRSTYAYPTSFTPTFYSFNAGSPSQSRSTEGLRPAGVSHHGHRPRR
ncbi:MAG TPA: DUF4124 domain-containing protein [Burkholderiales bacterium]|jgi:hypothetical protein|nr:DUF4124 domain-containing protein [Burkholderiales bacterium]